MDMQGNDTDIAAVPTLDADPDSGAVRDERLDAFCRRHLPLVRRFVARRVSDPHLAADLTADIFVAVLESAHTFRRARGSEQAWVLGIARHVLAAEWSRRGRDRVLARRIDGQRLLDPDSVARLEERLDAERSSRKLYRALGTLPSHERAILEMVAIDGLSVAEAALELRISSGTARVQLHRARRRMRRQFEDPYPGPVLTSAEENCS
jgi:RNA polymerase sigma-70 factor, ECF subfamily